MPNKSRTGRVRLVAGVVLLAAALTTAIFVSGVLSSAPPAFIDLPPSQVLARAQSAAERAGSVHAVVHVTQGTQTETLTDDTSRNSGHQMIVAGPDLAEIVVVHRVAYIRGNSRALSRYFNLPGPVASRLAGRWVSFRSSDIGYAAVTVGVTLDSTLKALDPTGALHYDAPTRISGTRTIGVTGTSGAVDGTLYIDTTGAHLPVAAVQVSGKGTSRTEASIRLSAWGERIAISIPPGAIPISSFTTSTPPSTTAGD